ncbi:MAG: UDP-N-acetylmuramoyl-L-alanyl-D-glutamate--2,6-diaminopimelate ligase [Clostridia bacterium]|nr:UDP-N-acetylmuramoyl-L-alanyl-D-glutamate--2,6-diaminopimelate ligase [Clostridia bacterium]
MKLLELMSGIPILKWHADPDTEVTSVSSDSRKIASGAAFVALKGLKVDGRAWIPSAMEKGAVVVLCQEAPEIEVPYVLLEDARTALPHLLSNLYGHPEKSFRRIIGITGTNGKTTTSFMLKAIFDAAGHKTGLIGTTKYLVLNEEYQVDKSAAFLTTPDPELLFELFDAMRRAGVDTVIMEASSHALAFGKLGGIEFDYGIFTNLTQDHIDFHKTIAAYLEAKKKLFQVAKVGVFNMDDPAFSGITEGAASRIVTYSGKCEKADYLCEEVLSHQPDGIRYLIRSPQGRGEVELPIPGSFNVYNSLAAAAVAMECGIPLSIVETALNGMDGVKGRIERVPTDTPYSVFIDFAHTPDALENILTTLRSFTKGRLVTLFGCGGDRDRTKRPIMGKIACEKSDFVIVTSDNCRTEKKEAIIADILEGVRDQGTDYVSITDRTEAIHYAIDHALPGDVILLAGKGHEEYEIDENGKHDYSERNIVLEYVREELK